MSLIRQKFIKKNKWTTLEYFFNAKGVAFFKAPKSSAIKVRYGVGWIGKDRQNQKLDGTNYKKLAVSNWSLVGARMQIKVPQDGTITYYYDGSGVAQNFPKTEF